MSRDEAVKQHLGEAIERMEMIADPLDLWITVALAPEVLPLITGAEGADVMSLALGSITRNTRTVLNEDHVAVTFPEGKVVNVPYAAIYCAATAGSLADMLGWVRSTELSQDIAYLDMVEPEHNIPGFHGLSSTQ
jgi:hypothetical protein